MAVGVPWVRRQPPVPKVPQAAPRHTGVSSVLGPLPVPIQYPCRHRCSHTRDGGGSGEDAALGNARAGAALCR